MDKPWVSVSNKNRDKGEDGKKVYPVKNCADCGTTNRKEDTVCWKCGCCNLYPASREDEGQG